MPSEYPSEYAQLDIYEREQLCGAIGEEEVVKNICPKPLEREYPQLDIYEWEQFLNIKLIS